MRKGIIIVLAVVCLVSVGCNGNKRAKHGVVCRITVSRDGETTVYTAPEKMTQILNGLRQLGQKTLATLDPEILSGAAYEITLECTDGENTVYHTKGECFLRRNQEPWKQTNASALLDLLYLLQSLPPDG